MIFISYEVTWHKLSFDIQTAPIRQLDTSYEVKQKVKNIEIIVLTY